MPSDETLLILRDFSHANPKSPTTGTTGPFDSNSDLEKGKPASDGHGPRHSRGRDTDEKGPPPAGFRGDLEGRQKMLDSQSIVSII